MKVLIGICAAILMGACVQPLQLDGRACGCAMGYVCCETTGVCIAQTERCPMPAPDAQAPRDLGDLGDASDAGDASDTGAAGDVGDLGGFADAPVELAPSDAGDGDAGADGPETQLAPDAPPAGPWTPVAPDPLIAGRSGHSVLWAGDEMIIWGGQTSRRVLTSGARYNPETGRWTAISEVGATGSSGHTAVWTGTEMIVWGGTVVPEGTEYLRTGARYDPRADRWTDLPSDVSVTPRTEHTAVWTGEEMLIWGGQREVQPFPDPSSGDWVGARYHPVNGWSAMTVTEQPPSTYSHTAVWAGDRMIVWGGNSSERHRSVVTGGMYDPVADRWTATSFDGNPGPRLWHSAVWTGGVMIVWGGYNSGPLGPPTPWTLGGRFDPSANRWSPMATDGAGGPRLHHVAIWAPAPTAKMLIWGGVDQPLATASGTLATGAAYDATADRWDPLTATGSPAPRCRHTAIWTGAEMILWGGLGLDETDAFPLGDGARYAPP